MWGASGITYCDSGTLLFVNLKINKVEHVEHVEPVQHQLKMNISLLFATFSDFHFHAKVWLYIKDAIAVADLFHVPLVLPSLI